MSFASLGLSSAIVDAVAEQGYDTPSPIQLQAIPAVLEGHDVMAAAQTGTGKTAGFTLPILELLSRGPRPQANQARALILTPTRELAAQVAASVATYSKNLPLRSTVVFGGVRINPQMQALLPGVDVLVATPGRLLDLYNQNAVKFKHLEMLVLDEADRMLDMGFIHDIRKIIKLLPEKRQTLMFSATFSEEVRALAKGLVNDPVEISVSPRNAAAPSVEQWVCPVDKNQKTPVLIKMIKDNNWKQVLVFSRTKHGANKITRSLEAANISAAAIHGNKSQGARTKALADFKSGEVRILVATDIAARGIDIDQLPQVVNFDLPNVAEDYVHRIGRTGRAGSTGEAISLVCADEFAELSDIERLTQKILERRLLTGFVPVHPLPESNLNTRPIRPKKAKKPKKPRVDHRDGQRSGDIAQGHKPPGTGGKPPGSGQGAGGGQGSGRKPQGSGRGSREGTNERSSDRSTGGGQGAGRKPQGAGQGAGRKPQSAGQGAGQGSSRKPQGGGQGSGRKPQGAGQGGGQGSGR